MKTKCTRCGEMTNAPIIDHVKDGKNLIDGPICMACFRGEEAIPMRNSFALPAQARLIGKAVQSKRDAVMPKLKARRATGFKSKGYSVFPYKRNQGDNLWHSATYHGNGNGGPRVRMRGKPTAEFVDALVQAIAAAREFGTYNHSESQKYLQNLQIIGEYSVAHLIDGGDK